MTMFPLILEVLFVCLVNVVADGNTVITEKNEVSVRKENEEISDLVKRVRWLERKTLGMARELSRLTAPSDVLYATGYKGNEYEPVALGDVFRFTNETIDRLGSYDVTTGIFTAQRAGVYSFMISTRSRSGLKADLRMYLQKDDGTEQRICRARANPGYIGDVCSALFNLNAGDHVIVRGGEDGETAAKFSKFQAVFLY